MPAKISIFIPCYNEELTIEKCLFSCLNQTRLADEIIVVDDCSTDKTPKILEKFKGVVKTVKTPKNTGNKSSAQEYGLKYITGDFFITTDADTMLDSKFVETVEKDMEKKSVAAVAGYVRSLKYNWITACRALDYAISQNIDKLAQFYMDSIYVIPGAAGVFRTDVFKKEIIFSHDTITEDLDFTFILHELGYNIAYNRKAVCYTQDPSTLKSYINQMRRWMGGGWQNILKHSRIPDHPGRAIELSLIYIEGLLYSFLLVILPFINLEFTFSVIVFYSMIIFLFSIYGAAVEKRADLIFAFPAYFFLKYVNAWIFLEQFLLIMKSCVNTKYIIIPQ